MSGTPNKLIRFWRELKRRRVIHVITVYASASFVLIELVNNLSEPLNLPPKLATIVIILLAIGFPLAVILGWIYDLTPGGIEKTRQVEELDEDKSRSVPNAWRIATYLSFVVIAILLAWNIIRSPALTEDDEILSIVVLPFENYTGDDQLDHMVAGMHSLLIGDLGRISGLRVVGKTSSNTFRNTDKTAKEISRELNVGGVVESTVMCIGDTVCMQFRLVSTTGEEKQLWVGDFQEDKGQILNLYNQLTRQIAEEVSVELTEDEQQILEQDRQTDREAMDAFILSHAYWGDLGRQSLDDAEKYLKIALEKDPHWAPTYAAMAGVWVGKLQMGFVEISEGRQMFFKYYDRANELNPGFTDSYFIKAAASCWVDWNWEQGEREFLQGLAQRPNHILMRMYYAHLLVNLQRIEEAKAQAQLALELDPKNPMILTLYSVVLKADGQHEKVLEYLNKALAIDPEHSFANGQMGRAYYNIGAYEEDLLLTQKRLENMLGKEGAPDLISLYRTQGKQAAYKEILRLSKQRTSDSSYRPTARAIDYYRWGAYSETLDELEKAYRQRDPNLPYVGTGTRFEALHDSTRFLAVLDSMNLPHPVRP